METLKEVLVVKTVIVELDDKLYAKGDSGVLIPVREMEPIDNPVDFVFEDEGGKQYILIGAVII